MPVPTQKPNSPPPTLLELIGPLRVPAVQAADPIYDKLFTQAQIRGFGTAMAEFANSVTKLDPQASEAIKETMDTITDPIAKIKMIKSMPQIRSLWQATLRANPKTQLILQDAFELAKQDAVYQDRNTFFQIFEMGQYLNNIRDIKQALHIPDDGTEAQFETRNKAQLLAAYPEQKPAVNQPSDYYVPSYYYIFGMIPRSHVVLLPIGQPWDESMPGPELDFLYEQYTTAMNDYLLMAKMNSWADTIINYALQKLGLNAAEVMLLSQKLDDIMLSQPEPDQTLKARQDVMQASFMAVRTVLNLRTMGVKHVNLFTYVLFMDSETLYILDRFCQSMCNNLMLNNILRLWSQPAKQANLGWFQRFAMGGMM